MTTRKAFEEWVRGYSTLSIAKDGCGYLEMTVEMLWHAWQAGISFGRHEAASAAANTARATALVESESPDDLRESIAQRIDDVAKPTHWSDGLCEVRRRMREGGR